jgi:molybdopterin-guanine dinucleotide biosynthesis protein B
MHELRGEAEPSLDEQIARFSACDLVLVEGFKGEAHPKLEVRRRDSSGPPLADDFGFPCGANGDSLFSFEGGWR